MARAAITMGDELQRPNLFAQRVHRIIRHIPNGHAVGGVADAVMVRHDANAANRPGIQQALQPSNHRRRIAAQLRSQRVIGLQSERSSGLGGENQRAQFCHNNSPHPLGERGWG